MIISLIALGISTFLHRQTYVLSRKQGIASVKPYLDLRSTINNKKRETVVKLVNYGIGPAFLKSFKYQYSEKYYDTFSECWVNINKAIKEKLQLKTIFDGACIKEDEVNEPLLPMDKLDIEFELRLYNNVIGVNEEIILLKISAKEEDAYEILKNRLSEIRVYSEYQDIYEKDIIPMKKFI